jgi:hypothetical protein
MNVDPPTQGRALQVGRTHEARFNREYFEVESNRDTKP